MGCATGCVGPRVGGIRSGEPVRVAVPVQRFCRDGVGLFARLTVRQTHHPQRRRAGDREPTIVIRDGDLGGRVGDRDPAHGKRRRVDANELEVDALNPIGARRADYIARQEPEIDAALRGGLEIARHQLPAGERDEVIVSRPGAAAPAGAARGRGLGLARGRRVRQLGWRQHRGRWHRSDRSWRRPLLRTGSRGRPARPSADRGEHRRSSTTGR